ncbi:hypothetical protein HDC93_002351 [Streptomyces sp. AK010]|nr:hypothetical protein [Streptomyces sp. AK010]
MRAAARPRPFGRYGSPSARLTPGTLYVHPGGAGDVTTVREAVAAANGTGHTLVIAPGTYRETVAVDRTRTAMTWIGGERRPRDVVVVYDNAAGTPKPGGGTHGTTGSATTTVQADGFSARWITFANDWLRADHPDITGTQAVALKVQGDRSAFHHCRFLGHQDTLYADSTALGTFARQYFSHCYAEGDVDFVFGRATAVFEHCHFRTLARDVDFTPKGMVFAPSTARANPQRHPRRALPDHLRRRGRGVQTGPALGAVVRDHGMAVAGRAGDPDRARHRRGGPVHEHAGRPPVAEHAFAEYRTDVRSATPGALDRFLPGGSRAHGGDARRNPVMHKGSFHYARPGRVVWHRTSPRCRKALVAPLRGLPGALRRTAPDHAP